MDGSGECARAYVKSEILAYIERMPQASDTVDGIVDWWLYDQRLRIGREVVLAALSDLVGDGALEKRRIPPDTIVYAMPATRQPNADKE
ncbi:hypothetical protein [Mesorhizobium sp. IMUNJ 23232]|uniref:hypothetical protein n=1 Tax=Mesorhizobium sp. IMUNJ 23232 TaxID=3376064 RepID=UPI00379D907C